MFRWSEYLISVARFLWSDPPEKGRMVDIVPIQVPSLMGNKEKDIHEYITSE